MFTSTKIKDVGVPVAVLVTLIGSIIFGGHWAGRIETNLDNVMQDVADLKRKIDRLIDIPQIPNSWRNFDG